MAGSINYFPAAAVRRGNLQITCFSLGSFESRWKVAFVNLLCNKKIELETKFHNRSRAYFLVFGVTGTCHDVSQNFVEASFHCNFFTF